MVLAPKQEEKRSFQYFLSLAFFRGVCVEILSYYELKLASDLWPQLQCMPSCLAPTSSVFQTHFNLSVQEVLYVLLFLKKKKVNCLSL